METGQPAITRNADIQGGTPVFTGTRVPVAIMLDYLAAGQALDDFLEQYPSVDRDQALRALDEMKSLLAPA